MRSHCEVLFRQEFGEDANSPQLTHHNCCASFQGESSAFEKSGVGKGRGAPGTQRRLTGSRCGGRGGVRRAVPAEATEITTNHVKALPLANNTRCLNVWK